MRVTHPGQPLLWVNYVCCPQGNISRLRPPDQVRVMLAPQFSRDDVITAAGQTVCVFVCVFGPYLSKLQGYAMFPPVCELFNLLPPCSNTHHTDMLKVWESVLHIFKNTNSLKYNDFSLDLSLLRSDSAPEQEWCILQDNIPRRKQNYL